MSITADCWIGSSRPTAPKSMRPRPPSRKAKMLPGCGSAWKSPIRRIWSSVVRSSSLGERGRGRSRPRRSPGSRRRCTRRSAPARAVAGCSTRCTRAGRARTSRAPSSIAISSMTSASWPKSSSARRLTANCASSSPERRPWPNVVRRCATLARSASAARSRSITSSMPGRWIFTTTASPVRSRAE